MHTYLPLSRHFILYLRHDTKLWGFTFFNCRGLSTRMVAKRKSYLTSHGLFPHFSLFLSSFFSSFFLPLRPSSSILVSFFFFHFVHNSITHPVRRLFPPPAIVAISRYPISPLCFSRASPPLLYILSPPSLTFIHPHYSLHSHSFIPLITFNLLFFVPHFFLFFAISPKGRALSPTYLWHRFC